ncbi:MAG: beta,4-mannosyltransferase [Actinomycetota bacterium]|jgi:egghead protein (zeste-white 4 protein)|nr:beta,4-mannosyltransferase [Actinomycetota bacterium]
MTRTGHRKRWDAGQLRAFRLIEFVAIFVLILWLRHQFFPAGRAPVLWWEHALQLMSWSWLGALPAAAVAVISLALPAAVRPAGAGTAIPQTVCFRVVSRGRNAEALADTVRAVRKAMKARPLFPYCIEVVTDEWVKLPKGSDLRAYVVPTEYTTPRGSLYKARALHYLSENSTLPDSAWVFHCDEESQVTIGLVGGIRDAVVEEELRALAGKTPRIGQGTIVYWRSLQKHPLLTLADSLRTGDDATRFRTQFRLGALFCGMHGSFILVRADIERTVSFDVGPEGSITEDAWWAFAQAFFGREFRWVDGYLVEQSPEHWKDFAKQRRRWYCGLWKVVLYSPAPVAARAALAGFLITWVVSAFGGLYTVANLFTGLTTPVVPAVMGAFVFAWYVSSYLTGLWLSLRSMPAELFPSLPKRCVLYVAQLVLLPLFGALESAGVFYAMVKPERGFHVIKKSGEKSGLASATPQGRQPVGATK